MNTVTSKNQNQINIINVISNLAMGTSPLTGGLFLKLADGVAFSAAGRNFDNYDILFVFSALLFIAPYILLRNLRKTGDLPTFGVLTNLARPIMNMFSPIMGQDLWQNNKNRQKGLDDRDSKSTM